MNIDTISLSQLVPSKTNPRKVMKDIAGLAASIKTDDLLQNLVVKPLGGKGKRYGIISGERRYRALKLLEERGELPKNFPVPVEIRKGLSEEETLRIATVENLQRANLAPLEEAAALTKLIHKGTTLEDVAAQTGLSPSTIKRRLALNGLCKEAKAVLRGGGISLAQAEALTLGNHEAQCRLLEELERGYSDYSAEAIKEHLLDERPTVSLAIFPLEEYSGTITTDLFAEGETSYFDDAEQFFKLQTTAVEKLVDAHRQVATWVEVTSSYSIPDWQYREAKKREASGVLINLSPRGEVTVREGLAKHEIDKETALETTEHPLAPREPRATYAAPLRRYIAYHKSAAVQEILLSSPRKAKQIAAVKALLELEPHACIRSLSKESEPQTAYRVIEGQARTLAGTLGLAIKKKSIWDQLPSKLSDDVALYEAVKNLTDHELDELQTLVAALAFGQKNCDSLDTGDTLFNRVAKDLQVDMKNHWKPDRSFLGRRSRLQLAQVAKECGYAEGRSGVASYKKSELVAGLDKHFAKAFSTKTPTEAQKKAMQWLPEAMSFPAVNPDEVKKP
jgi:ParB family chromosome partitioning protein